LEAIIQSNILLRHGKSLSGRERNRVFLNTRQRKFANGSSVSGLDFLDDARGMGIVDWDGDGDLDLWLTNRTAPMVRIMRNNTDRPGDALTLGLEGRTVNRDGIGARVHVYLEGRTVPLIRSLRAGDGFISQTSKWLHFGLGADQTVRRVSVRWPNQKEETFDGVSAGGRYRLIEGEGRARPIQPRKTTTLAASPYAGTETESSSATRLALPFQLTRLEQESFAGETSAVDFADSEMTLVNLWASWCAPCLTELTEFTRREKDLRDAGITVLPLSVDGLGDTRSDAEAAQRMMKRIGFPFPHARATRGLLARVEMVLQQIFYLSLPLPVPTSLLVNERGELVAVYKGPVTVDDLLADVSAVSDRDPSDYADVVPLEGRQYTVLPPRNYNQLAEALMRKGFRDDALAYVEATTRSAGEGEVASEILVNAAVSFARERRFDRAEKQLNRAIALNPREAAAYYNLGLIHKSRREGPEAEAALRKAVALAPDYSQALDALGEVLMAKGDLSGAIEALEEAVRLDPTDGRFRNTLGIALARADREAEAADQLARSLELRPDWPETLYNLARIYIGQSRVGEARELLDRALSLEPEMVPARVELIWITAASKRDSLRDGARALRLARGLVAMKRDARSLQLLAAAQAAAGNRDDARASLTEAHAMTDDARLRSQLESMARTIEAGQPFRHPRY